MFRKMLAWVLLLSSATVATAANLIPAKTFNTTDWASTMGFQTCSGGVGYSPCLNGSEELVFSVANTQVSRSFTIASPISSASFLVNVQGVPSGPSITDTGAAYLRAFDAANQKLAEATFTSSALNSTVQPVQLVLSDAGVLSTATRIEVVISGWDAGGWAGNYGPVFSTPRLFINDADGDTFEDSIDADDDGDGVIDHIQVSAGDYSTCALTNDGVQCWGDTSTGQTSVPTLDEPVSISAGMHVCALDTAGVHCWGNNGNGQTNVPVLSNPQAVSAGGFHTCALDDVGVRCWGYNYEGQTTVPPLDNPVAVYAGYLHTCALDADGVHCWGDNAYGKATVPVGLVDPVAVSAGINHTCAVDASGVTCWGRNDFGQLDVPALDNPVAVVAGSTHSCALDDTGVHCWGHNSVGQIDVPVLDTPQSITAGAYHTCAVDKVGVHCWGYNSNGQSAVPATLSTVVDNCPLIANTDQLDTDSDGMGNICDPDMDGDGVANANDVFPLDTTETVDNDGDGTGDNADTDDDNDGVPDENDAFPLDENESVDTDNDGIGNNADTDDDNDTVLDENDIFPLDDTETEDTDGDNLGDNGDPFPDDANTLNYYRGNTKMDKTGTSVAFAGDFDGDGYGDYVIGIPGYDVPAVAPAKPAKDAGRVVIVSGKNGSELFSMRGDSAKDGLGFAVAGGKDIDHDGFDDVVAGAPLADDTMSGIKDAGAIRVIYGPDGDRWAGRYGTEAKAMFGAALALGDVNGDGHADVFVGAPKSVNATGIKPLKQAGRVLVLSGADLLGGPLLDVYGETAKAYAGTAVATGDVNGDDRADFIIGAPNHMGEGIVLLYTADGTPVRGIGGSRGSRLGQSLAMGDIDGDGHADLLVGAPGDDDTTNRIKDTGSISAYSGSTGGVLALRYGTTAKAGLGSSVAVGDVDGDGKGDLISGAVKDDSPTLPKATKDTGSVSVWYGNTHSTVATWYGAAKGDGFGTAISAGDVNGDGKADVVIGMPGVDIPPAPPAKTIKDAGAVNVISGASL